MYKIYGTNVKKMVKLECTCNGKKKKVEKPPAPLLRVPNAAQSQLHFIRDALTSIQSGVNNCKPHRFSQALGVLYLSCSTFLLKKNRFFLLVIFRFSIIIFYAGKVYGVTPLIHPQLYCQAYLSLPGFFFSFFLSPSLLLFLLHPFEVSFDLEEGFSLFNSRILVNLLFFHFSPFLSNPNGQSGNGLVNSPPALSRLPGYF